jgi:hypothetical protein
LLGLFEERAPAGIVLLKFESDAGTGRVEITGHAAASKALGEFVVALEADKRLSGVLLHQHRVMRDEPGAPIEFTLGASWGAVSAPAPPAASASEAVQ